MHNIHLFPPAFSQKVRIKAFNRVMDSRFDMLKTTIFDHLFIFSLTTQSDTVLDHLALQFKADGYEFTTSRQQKINLIQGALSARLKKGTRFALNRLFTALNVDIEIHEWPLYQGTPFTYRIELQGRSLTITPDVQRKLIRLIQAYTNKRSHPDDVKLSYLVTSPLTLHRALASELEAVTAVPRTLIQNRDLPVRTGAAQAGECIAGATPREDL